MSRESVEAILEAVLFVAPDPVSIEALEELLGDIDRNQIDDALVALGERYPQGESARGVFLEQVAGGYRLVTRPELNGYLESFFQARVRSRLSMQALETLTIIAYRQPVTAPEIQDLRGVNSSAVLKTLLDNNLVRISGRKKVVGKPFLYRTTNEFLEHFGLASISDLPPLEEFGDGLASLEAQELVADLQPRVGQTEDLQEDLDLTGSDPEESE